MLTPFPWPTRAVLNTNKSLISTGSVIRVFGITVNNHGMYLRIPEIEATDRKRSMMFLTDNSDEILDFLGLDPHRWWSRFSSQEEMFEYAAGCRMFCVNAKKTDSEREGDTVTGRSMTGQDNIESGMKSLKHNDRARLQKRPIFREWMTVFVPLDQLI
jgi:hypothetical protein